MQKQTLIGLMLATSVAVSALAGCQIPSAMVPGKTAPGTQLAPSKQAAATDNSQSTADAMADEQEIEDTGYMADDADPAPAQYAVALVGGPKAGPGEVAITAALDGDVAASAAAKPLPRLGQLKGKLADALKAKITARRTLLKEKAKARLAKKSAERQKLAAAAKNAAWIVNADGTKSKTVEFSVTKTVNGGTMTKSSKLVRTVNADGTLVSSETTLTQTLPNGASRTSTRTKTLQEDGSYAVTFNATHSFKDGRSRVAQWEKNISADGAVTGTGTITFKDASGAVTKTVTITLGGTEEKATAAATDTATSTTTAVTATVEGTITAEATDTDTGTTAAVAIDTTATTETTAPAATDASATTSASASATVI